MSNRGNHTSVQIENIVAYPIVQKLTLQQYDDALFHRNVFTNDHFQIAVELEKKRVEAERAESYKQEVLLYLFGERLANPDLKADAAVNTSRIRGNDTQLNGKHIETIWDDACNEFTQMETKKPALFQDYLDDNKSYKSKYFSKPKL